jgi:hypothetical protein
MCGFRTGNGRIQLSLRIGSAQFGGNTLRHCFNIHILNKDAFSFE